MINHTDHGLGSSDEVRNYYYCILFMHSWVCHFIWSYGLCKYVRVLCTYVCIYVRTNVAMYVRNPSDMLQAQLDGTNVLKHPHEYYCQV